MTAPAAIRIVMVMSPEAAYLAQGDRKGAVAVLLDVAPNTFYAWLKVRRPVDTPGVTQAGSSAGYV